MAIRYDDAARVLTLSALDLVEAGAGGHLVLEVAVSRGRRLRQGREVHEAWQRARADDDEAFRPEVRLRVQLALGGWTVLLHGRVDGLSAEDGRTLVEEVKSTALDADRLFRTDPAHWPRYTAQLEIYLWMLAQERHPQPTGHLVLVSLADGSRHLLGVPLGHERVDAWIRARLEDLVRARERRNQWLAARRSHAVPWPFPGLREGQEAMLQAVERAMHSGDRLLLQAPTGTGKTAAVLVGALRHALRHDQQVFWATARTTQQEVVARTAALLAAEGLPLRVLTLTAKEKVCLNEVVACDPERCRFARDHHDKLRDGDVVFRVAESGGADAEGLRAAGLRHEICPFGLSVSLADHVDLVIGDYNYAFDPAVHLRRPFGEGSGGWIVVVDEAHQLVERARGYVSPRVPLALARQARALLAEQARFEPFALLAAEVEERLAEDLTLAGPPARDGEALLEPSTRAWRELADRLEEVALDYALLRAERPLEGDDPYPELVRAVLRLVDALEALDEDAVAVGCLRPGEEAVGVVCLDPSGWLGPRLAALGGLVCASATLSPPDFYRDLLGLHPDRLARLELPPAFPPEHRLVIVLPRVSTAFRDRAAHAPATAALMERCLHAIPGNAAVYFPSFAMLRDLTARWSLPDRELLLQEPGMADARRGEWLRRLGEPGPPVVLAAVLGGIFAEGIDLPPGALRGVLVCGPGLPPVGLERDLLSDCYEKRYGEGFRYASLVPGLTRVVQAAGRLHRRPEDRGVVVLLDRRFRWRDYAALLPEHWAPEVVDDPVEAIEAFWGQA